MPKSTTAQFRSKGIEITNMKSTVSYKTPPAKKFTHRPTYENVWVQDYLVKWGTTYEITTRSQTAKPFLPVYGRSPDISLP